MKKCPKRLSCALNKGGVCCYLNEEMLQAAYKEYDGEPPIGCANPYFENKKVA